MVGKRPAMGFRGGAGIVLVAVAGLALSLACQTGPTSSPAKDAGTEVGNVGDSLWEIVVPPADVYTAVWLAAPGTIYAVANDNASQTNGAGYSVTASHDDGKTWTTVPLTDKDSPILSVAAVGATDVYAVGLTYEPADVNGSSPLVAKSTDRGATFTLLHPTFTGSFTAVSADGAGNPIGVGFANDGGFFVRSTDGGATWSHVGIPGTQALVALWTTTSGTIYACGQAARASDPPDGGTDARGTDDGTDAGAPGAYVGPAGVVVRSDDGGNSWTTVATTPASLFAVSGTSDGQRIIAVGYGFTEIESTDGGGTWHVNCVSSDDGARYSGLGSVWVPDAQSDPFIAAGNAPYLLRYLSCYEGESSLYTSEPLPIAEPIPPAAAVLQSGAIAVAGNATEVWAVGAGIFRRM